MRQTNWTNELSYHTESESREILAKEAKIMEERTKYMEDHDGEDAKSVWEDVNIEDEELEINC